jgi:hypothetical protein
MLVIMFRMRAATDEGPPRRLKVSVAGGDLREVYLLT